MKFFSCYACAVLLCAVAASAASTPCVVRNTDADGRGSLRECMQRANDAPGGIPYLITFSRAFREGGLTIPLLINEDGTCSGMPFVNNPNSGSSVKDVIIRAPRTRVEGGHVRIVATDPACANVGVFNFGVDVSVNMRNMVTVGGGTGLLVLGASAVDGAIQESVTLDHVTIADATGNGVLLIDIREVTITDSIFTGNGNDGFKYEHLYGTDGIYEITSTGSHFEFNGQVDTTGDGLDIVPKLNAGIIKLRDCEFTNNADDGLSMRAATESSGVPDFPNSQAQIVNSRFNDNGEEGILALFVDIEKIVRSEVNGNGDDGMSFIAGRLSYAYKTTFNGNGDDGMDITEADVTLMRLCEINNNAQWGIELEVVVIEGSQRVSTIKEYELISNMQNSLGSFICNEQVVASSNARSAKAGAIEAAIKVSDDGDSASADLKN